MIRPFLPISYLAADASAMPFWVTLAVIKPWRNFNAACLMHQRLQGSSNLQMLRKHHFLF